MGRPRSRTSGRQVTILHVMQNPILPFSLRLATQADEPALHALIEASVRVLQRNDYTPDKSNAPLATWLGSVTNPSAAKLNFSFEPGLVAPELFLAAGAWTIPKTFSVTNPAPI